MVASGKRNDSLRVDVIIDEDTFCPLDEPSMIQAVIEAAAERGCRRGQVGVRVTDDESIREINRTHLSHDYPTDVISFGYSLDPPTVEGELVVSAETACAAAAELSWSAANELRLYIVHGTLHLCGMDDQQSDSRAEMRQAESAVMRRLGIEEIDRYAADVHDAMEEGA